MADQRDTFLNSLRWLPVCNNSGETIPPFACMRVVGMATDKITLKVGKPNVASSTRLLFNGPSPIPDGRFGSACYETPTLAAYETADGVPLNGEFWGCRPGSWLLRKAASGYRIDGVHATGIAMVSKCCCTPTVMPHGLAPYYYYRTSRRLVSCTSCCGGQAVPATLRLTILSSGCRGLDQIVGSSDTGDAILTMAGQNCTLVAYGFPESTPVFYALDVRDDGYTESYFYINISCPDAEVGGFAIHASAVGVYYQVTEKETIYECSWLAQTWKPGCDPTGVRSLSEFYVDETCQFPCAIEFELDEV